MNSALKLLRINIPCQFACPAKTAVPSYIRAIFDREFDTSYKINRADNFIPGILGRICTRPCEESCRHGREGLGKTVSICHLKRSSHDLRAIKALTTESIAAPTNKRIAVVGAGPAGLIATHLLSRLGHKVVLFEKESRPGGMMIQAIPSFRLPEELCLSEIHSLFNDNVEIRLNQQFGRDTDLESLSEQFDAIILACGCSKSIDLGIDGTTLAPVHSGLEFLKAAKRGEISETGRNVLIIGGGFTAIDCARVARRLGSEKVTLAIRRTRANMSVREEDIEDTLAEGVGLLELISPIGIRQTDDGLAVHMTRNRLRNEADGRQVAEAINGTEFTLNADDVIVAIGQRVNDSQLDLKTLQPVSPSGKTVREGVYLAGDCMTGPSSVINAIGHAKELVMQVDKDLTGEDRIVEKLLFMDAEDTVRPREWDSLDPVPMPKCEIDARLSERDLEVEQGYDDALAEAESRRCYLCDLDYSIRSDECIFCDRCIDQCPQSCIDYNFGEAGIGSWMRRLTSKPKGIAIDSEPCIRCGICYKVCPVACIDVKKLSYQSGY